MRKLFFGLLVGVFLGSLGVVIAQTPTIFSSVRVTQGTCATPAYSFTADTSDGLCRVGANQIRVASYDGANDTGSVLLDSGAVAEARLQADTAGASGILAIHPSDMQVVGAFGGAILEVDFSTSAIETLDLRADTFGYKGIPQVSQSGNYTIQFGDGAKQIFHPSGAGAGDTFTIPNDDFGGGITWQVGTVLTIINGDSNSLAIASVETVTLAGTTDATPCTLAQNGMATAVLVATSTWLINGTGITCP